MARSVRACLLLLAASVSVPVPVIVLPFCELAVYATSAPDLTQPQPQLSGSSRAGTVYLLKLEGSINPITKDYILRNLERANRELAAAVIIQLDTPGGLMSSMEAIVKAIFASEVPVIVWVGPAGSRAGSAGVFITLAADVAAMAHGTNIGAAHPVGLGGESPEEQSPMEEKITNDAAAFARSIAEKRGRNVEWAEEAVRKSASITSTDALREGVIDLIADSLDELLQELEGYPLGAREVHWAVEALLAELKELESEAATDEPDLAGSRAALDEGVVGKLVELNAAMKAAIAERDLERAKEVARELREVLRAIRGSSQAGSGSGPDHELALESALERIEEFLTAGRALHLSEAPIQELPMTLKDRLLNYLADPNVVYILLMIGIYGLIYEFFNPGLGFGLVAGGLSLLLAFMGLQILPVNLTGLALILFGVLLMVLDAFTPTTGILTTGGVISLLLGSFTLFDIQSPVMQLSWWNILVTTGLVTALFVFVISKGLLIQRKRPATGLEGMIGAVGEVREDLAPEGLVFVKGELWKAVSLDGQEVHRGEKVLIEGVDRGKLLVRRAKQ